MYILVTQLILTAIATTILAFAFLQMFRRKKAAYPSTIREQTIREQIKKYKKIAPLMHPKKSKVDSKSLEKIEDEKENIAISIMMLQSNQKKSILPLSILLAVGTGILIGRIFQGYPFADGNFTAVWVTYGLALALFVNNRITEYRVIKGYYGNNPHEAKQLIRYMLKNSEEIASPPGGGKKRKILVDPKEIEQRARELQESPGQIHV